jgi:hypothetical protein
MATEHQAGQSHEGANGPSTGDLPDVRPETNPVAVTTAEMLPGSAVLNTTENVAALKRVRPTVNADLKRYRNWAWE